MQKIRFLLFFYFLQSFWGNSHAQTILAGGQCIPTNITLNSIPDINGKLAFQGLGTVDGFSNVSVNIYWLGTPDNVWVLEFDGQPYFQNACDNPSPPNTTNTSCPWTTVGGTTCTSSEALFISGGFVVPVTLVNINAVKEGRKIKLFWTTASENDNKGFRVMRSADAENWKEVGFIAGAGNSTNLTQYHFIDMRPLAGKNYYRLEQVDFNGRSSYSRIVSAQIYNNSFYTLEGSHANGVFKINIEEDFFPVRLVLRDLNGRIISNRVLSSGAGFIDLQNQSSGIYLLQIEANGSIYTEKLIKN